MMQPCASAARLRGGGPILQCGMRAIGRPGSPPPRIVIASPPGNYGRAAKPSRGPRFGRAPSRRRTQDDTVRGLAGGHQTPQRDEQLARQRHDHGLARATASVRCPCPVPDRQTAGLLEPEETPGRAGSCRGARARCPPWRAPSPAAWRRSPPASPSGRRSGPPPFGRAGRARGPRAPACPPSRCRRRSRVPAAEPSRSLGWPCWRASAPARPPAPTWRCSRARRSSTAPDARPSPTASWSSTASASRRPARAGRCACRRGRRSST